MGGDMVGSSQAVLSFPNKLKCKNLLLAELGQDDAVIPGNIATDRANDNNQMFQARNCNRDHTAKSAGIVHWNRCRFSCHCSRSPRNG